AVVVQLLGGDGGVAGGVKLNRHVAGNHHRCDGINHCDCGGAGGAVAVIVSHRQGDGVGADVGAVKGGLVQAEVSDAAGVAAAVVNLFGGDGGMAGGVELHGQALAERHRRDGICHRDGGGAGGEVAVVVGHG